MKDVSSTLVSIALVALFCFSIVFVSNYVGESHAMAVFARKYETSCTTCHIAPPARNPFGEAFRRNGYVMPLDDEEFIKQEDVSLGSEEWKRVFPDAVWPGVIPQSFPFGAYVHNRLVMEFKEDDPHVEFDAPHEFELLLGGSFGESIGFVGEWVAFEKGKNAPGLKRFFFQFNDLFGPENAFNMRVGRFEPGITDGYTDSNRYTLEHVKTVDYKATGQWRPRDQQSGIEFLGILRHRTNYAVGIVNGNNTSSGVKNSIKDPRDRKDVYFRVGHKIGGRSMDGVDEAEESGEELIDTENWVDNTLQLGVYGYFGSIDDEVNTVDDSKYGRNFNRFGGDAMFGYNDLKILAGAIVGTDEDVGVPGATDVESLAWFCEANYLIYPWLIGIARFGGANTEQGSIELDNYTDFSANLTILARANARISLEAYFKSEG